MSDSVTITLSSDEALVLFEWLSSREKHLSRAEETTLAVVLCGLESALVDPFKRDYAQLVDAARRRLLARDE